MAWAPDYTTTAALAAYTRIGDGVDDVQIGLSIAAASRAIDRATGRQFGLVAAAEARHYTARLDAVRGRWLVPIDDLMTQVGLEVATDTAADLTYAGTITDYVLRPVNAAPAGWPWTELVVRAASTAQPTGDDAEVQVTARWGWSAVPDAVEQACLLQASRLLARRDSPYGIAGSPEAGSEVRLLAKVDPDVEVALAAYRRRGWVFA